MPFNSKSDKNGAPVYLHRVSAPSASIGSAAGAKFAHQPKSVPPTNVGSSRCGDVETLNRAYRLLLTKLTLADEHRQALLARGLTETAIVQADYRSVPRRGRAPVARELHTELGDDYYFVPGFTSNGRGATLAGPVGLLIPCRNLNGSIVAIKIRRDGYDGESGKYVYMSSARNGGPGPGSPAHVPLGIGPEVETVRLTEGELKADIATVLSDVPTISAPGAANFRPSIEVIRSLNAKTVRLAFDADASTNPNVARAQVKCAEAIRSSGFRLELERWDPADGKGIDDLLAAGKTAEVLTGDEAMDAVRAMAKAAGVSDENTAPVEALAKLPGVLEADGPAGLFRDSQLLNSLAYLSVTNQAEFAAQREVLRNAKVRMRELDRLLKPIIKTIRAKHSSPAGESEAEKYFVSSENCLCREKPTPDGPISVPLCNFAARIVEQTTHDDGVERQMVLAIEGALHGGQQLPRVEISADEFPRMNWPVTSWGTRAVVYAGFGTKDHLRTAMQVLSGDVPRRDVYGHTGWRRIGDNWFYLHGGGAIGSHGVDTSVTVALPDALGGYCLPEPQAGTSLVNAIHASLGLVQVAPQLISYPLLASVYRAVLGQCDFGLHLAGPTGVFKTELAALAQQHFGAGLDARHLPGSWSSTANALEGTAFAAKDALLVVDDFAPTGSTYDVQRMHREADRLFRAQGNHSGRQRMRADGSLRAAKPPRGLILSTGEDVPRGQSLRSRLLIEEIEPGTVRLDQLTQCQRDASEGQYAKTLSAFVRWLAPRYEDVRGRLRSEVTQLRDRSMADGQHARTPSIVADLAIGLRYFLDFAVEVGALTAAESDGHWKNGSAAITAAAENQAAHQAMSEPAGQFLRLSSAVLSSGRAHVASVDGKVPWEAPEAWGWRGVESGTGTADEVHESWHAQGRRIGWIDGDDVYLEPEAAFAEAQRLAADQGDGLPIAQRTLVKRLREKGHLLTTDPKRKTNTIRKTLEGRRREIIHLHRLTLSGEKLTNLTNAGPSPENTADSGQFAGQVAGQFPCPVDHRRLQIPPDRGYFRQPRAGVSGRTAGGRPWHCEFESLSACRQNVHALVGKGQTGQRRSACPLIKTERTDRPSPSSTSAVYGGVRKAAGRC